MFVLSGRQIDLVAGREERGGARGARGARRSEERLRSNWLSDDEELEDASSTRSARSTSSARCARSTRSTRSTSSARSASGPSPSPRPRSATAESSSKGRAVFALLPCLPCLPLCLLLCSFSFHLPLQGISRHGRPKDQEEEAGPELVDYDAVCVSQHIIPFKETWGWWAHEGQQPEQDHQEGKAATAAAQAAAAAKAAAKAAKAAAKAAKAARAVAKAALTAAAAQAAADATAASCTASEQPARSFSICACLRVPPPFFLKPAALICTKIRPVWTRVSARRDGPSLISQYKSPVPPRAPLLAQQLWAMSSYAE